MKNRKLLSFIAFALLLVALTCLFTGCFITDLFAEYELTLVDTDTRTRKVTVNGIGGGMTLPGKRTGYEFCGYYTEDGVAFFDTKGSLVTGAVLSDGLTLYAKWDLITYHITYDLSGGTLEGNNPTEYTVETPATSLVNPTKKTGDFIGWGGLLDGRMVKDAKIGGGMTGDLHLTAAFEGDIMSITLHFNDDVLATKTYPVGTVITEENFPAYDLFSIEKAGFVTDKWYRSDKVSVYSFGAITENLDLYGDFHFFTDGVRFYPYLDTFRAAVQSEKLSVTDDQMLIAWIDYVRFYDITTKVYLSLPGKVGQAAMDAIGAAYRALMAEDCFESSSVYTHGYEGKGAYFVTTDSVRATEATKVMDPEGAYLDTQLKSANAASAPKTRADDFDAFPGLSLGRKISVTTSDQLVYVLMEGYVPVPEKDSPAETVLDTAKGILREIVSDDMNDARRLRAIYEWLILNVCYDNLAFSKSGKMDNTESRVYDSWFAEGALLRHVAVCEGISKAAVILARLEGIPIVRVAGNNHEWDRVMIGGVWYGFDATHGNLGISGEGVEALSYTGFLFTDAYKTKKGYTSTDRADLPADTLVCPYEYLPAGEDDLALSSKAELGILLEESAEALSGDETVTLEIAVPNGTNLNGWLSFVGLFYRAPSPDSWIPLGDSDGHEVYLLIFENS